MKTKYIQEIYYIAVFDSRNHAVQLYQYLLSRKLHQFQLIPTPCTLKAGCSYSIRFDVLEDYYILLIEAGKVNKKITSVYEAKRINKTRVLTQIEFKSETS